MSDRFCPYCGCDYVPEDEDECPECGLDVPLDARCPFCGAEMFPRDHGFCPVCGLKASAYPKRMRISDEFVAILGQEEYDAVSAKLDRELAEARRVREEKEAAAAAAKAASKQHPLKTLFKGLLILVFTVAVAAFWFIFGPIFRVILFGH
jgi:hypothetical protein